jgi:hypothetical protein
VAALWGSYLVTWAEYSVDHYGDIYGAIVPDLGPPGTPFVISARHTGDQFGGEDKPHIATNGKGYLVGWQDNRNDHYSDAGTVIAGAHGFAARVTASGSVLDPDGIQVTTEANSAIAQIASDGAGYLAVQGRDRAGIAAIPVSASGVVGPAVNLESGADAGTADAACSSNCPVANTGFLSLASAGGQYLAGWSVWVSGGIPPNVYGVLLTSSGVPAAPGVFGICSGVGCDDAVVAPVGDAFYSAWFRVHMGQPGTDDTYYDLYGSAISSTGAVASPNGELWTPTSLSASYWGPSLAMRTATQGLLAYNTQGTAAPAQVYRTRTRLISFEGGLPDSPDGGLPDSPDDTGGSSADDGGSANATGGDATTSGDDATVPGTEAAFEGGATRLADASAAAPGTGRNTSGGCSMGSQPEDRDTAILVILAGAALLARRTRSRAADTPRWGLRPCFAKLDSKPPAEARRSAAMRTRSLRRSQHLRGPAGHPSPREPIRTRRAPQACSRARASGADSA